MFAPRLFIAITGPVGSGKTTLSQQSSREIEKKFGKGSVQIVRQDNYYIPGGHPNYDVPGTIEWSLLLNHLCRLCHGEIITEAPRYNFVTKERHYDQILWPSRITIVEGHQLLLGIPSKMFPWDLKVYVNTPLTLCMKRRLQRDHDSFEQHMRQTLPAHYKYVEPQKFECELI